MFFYTPPEQIRGVSFVMADIAVIYHSESHQNTK